MSDTLSEKIKNIKEEKNAVILCHIYQNPEIQDIADYVGDSLGLSRQAADASNDIIVFCGVRFMAETAAVLNPEKKVLMPAPDAGCPMADMITPDQLGKLKTEYPDAPVVCYVNSTAEIKAMSDVCVTSANAVSIVSRMQESRVIFVPDRYLGIHVRKNTDKEIILWDGHCPAHIRIQPSSVEQVKKEYPGATVMVHPECLPEVQDIADHILSTGQMCAKAEELDNREFIIGTETGIIYTLQKQNPEKTFLPVSRDIICPDMKETTLENLFSCLQKESGRITVPDDVSERALKAITRMLEMSG